MYDVRQQRRLERLARRWQRGGYDRDLIYASVRHIVCGTPGKYTYQIHLCLIEEAGRSRDHLDELRSIMDEAIWRALECWRPERSPFWAYVDMRIEFAARKFWWASGLANDLPVKIPGQVWERYLKSVISRSAGEDYDEDLVAAIEAFRSRISLDEDRSATMGEGLTLLDTLASGDGVDELAVLLGDAWSRTDGLTADDEDILMRLMDGMTYDEIAAGRGRGETHDDVRERWLVVLDLLSRTLEGGGPHAGDGEASEEKQGEGALVE